MALFEWTSQLSVGIESIDREHRGLVEMINELHDSMLAGQADSRLKSVLDRLIAYTKTHFRAEEQLFAKHNYPAAAEHRKEHELLTMNVLELQAGLGAGRTRVTIETMRFLRDWLVSHIRKQDMAYKPFLASKNVK
jgi:hemerythrin-like metal-binding protein